MMQSNTILTKNSVWFIGFSHYSQGTYHPPPLNYHSHLADALQHFVKLTQISGVGKLLLLYVPATSQYFHFLIRNSHSENIVCQD
jgi:hypothetical protein